MPAPYTALDSSGNGHDLGYSGSVITNGSLWQQPGPYDGGTKNIGVLLPSFGGVFQPINASFECWINFQGITYTPGSFTTFFNSSTVGTATYAFGTRSPSANPQALSSQTSGFVNAVLSGVFPWGGWHHFVARRTSANRFDIIFDNVLIGSNIPCDEGSAGNFSIGTGSGGIAPCYMAALAVYSNTFLSDAQIAAHYAARTSHDAYKAAVLADAPSALWMLDEPGDVTTTAAGFYTGTITMGTGGVGATQNGAVIPFFNSDYGVYITGGGTGTITASMYQIVADPSQPYGYTWMLTGASVQCPEPGGYLPLSDTAIVLTDQTAVVSGASNVGLRVLTRSGGSSLFVSAPQQTVSSMQSAFLTGVQNVVRIDSTHIVRAYGSGASSFFGTPCAANSMFDSMTLSGHVLSITRSDLITTAPAGTFTGPQAPGTMQSVFNFGGGALQGWGTSDLSFGGFRHFIIPYSIAGGPTTVGWLSTAIAPPNGGSHFDLSMYDSNIPQLIWVEDGGAGGLFPGWWDGAAITFTNRSNDYIWGGIQCSGGMNNQHISFLGGAGTPPGSGVPLNVRIIQQDDASGFYMVMSGSTLITPANLGKTRIYGVSAARHASNRVALLMLGDNGFGGSVIYTPKVFTF